MFDDIQKTPGQAPDNLPMGEPEDMFRDADPGAETPSAPDAPTPAPSGSSSALGAGVLRPKTVVPPPQAVPATSSSSVHDPAMYRIKEPSIGKGIAITIISAVCVALVGGGGWYIYDQYVKNPEPAFPTVTTPTGNTDTTSDTTAGDVTDIPPAGDTTNEPSTPSGDVGSEIVDDKVLFGEPIDTDQDGLDDAKEMELGTDPGSWDTDADELSDRDEVVIWKTNALLADTDGDGYIDGLEVRSGYSPTGPGKLFQPPTTTAQ